MRRWIALAAVLPTIAGGAPAHAAGGPPSHDRALAETPVRPAAPYPAPRALTDAQGAPAGRPPVSPTGETTGRWAQAVPDVRARAAGGRYVALGDSFTAGPLIPRNHGRPFACLRSDHNYPSLVARALRAGEFVDVSCSAATTADLFRPQKVLLGSNPAQLDAVTLGTALVTVGIGGNDVGFSRTLYTCAGLSLTAPRGAPCMKHFGATLTERVTATAPRIAAVLNTIHERAPRALVIVVGYLRILPSDTGCWPAVPAAAGDVPYLDRVERSLNRMLADEARRGGALFVDDYRGGTGHDMCSTRRWVEPILITHAAAPVHPNATGMRVVAARVVATYAAARAAAAR
jgi:lysophospholipase L1-like esterase